MKDWIGSVYFSLNHSGVFLTLRRDTAGDLELREL
jgi:hypothetical protein